MTNSDREDGSFNIKDDVFGQLSTKCRGLHFGLCTDCDQEETSDCEGHNYIAAQCKVRHAAAAATKSMSLGLLLIVVVPWTATVSESKVYIWRWVMYLTGRDVGIRQLPHGESCIRTQPRNELKNRQQESTADGYCREIWIAGRRTQGAEVGSPVYRKCDYCKEGLQLSGIDNCITEGDLQISNPNNSVPLSATIPNSRWRYRLRWRNKARPDGELQHQEWLRCSRRN